MIPNVYSFYRDIKLENILISLNDEGEVEVKLIDFGCADFYQPGEIMTKTCGSLFYIAPEVWCNHYTEKCDIWSLGVVLFALLTKRFPFDDSNPKKIRKRTCKKKFRFRSTDK